MMRGGGGDQRGNRPGFEDELGVGARRVGDEAGEHEGCRVEIERHADVGHRLLRVEREGRGEHGAGAGHQPQRAIGQQAGIELHEADDRQQHDQADGQEIDRRRLGEDDAARGNGQRDGGERQPGDDAPLGRAGRVERRANIGGGGH